jgi:hypothetical protein
MNRPRLYDVRSSTLAQAVGLCATDIASISAIVNEAQERLINDPLAPEEGWWGSWIQMAFNVSQASPYFYTPREVSRVILLDVCKSPVIIRNQFYEFLEFGKGYMPSGCPSTNPCDQSLAAYERETVYTFTPLLSTAQTIRIYASDTADLGRTVLIQGKDSNGNIIRFVDSAVPQSGLGESMVLATPFTDSVNTFTEITGIQKQRTYGEVQIYQVDPTTGTETALVVMQPSEQTALYRKYFVNGLPTRCCNSSTTNTTLQVLAMCKLDYVPVQVDSDYLMIMSVPALIDECMSIRFGRIDTPGAQQLSLMKHQSALRLLFGQLDNYLGRERPAIRRSLFGSDPMQLQPV